MCAAGAEGGGDEVSVWAARAMGCGRREGAAAAAAAAAAARNSVGGGGRRLEVIARCGASAEWSIALSTSSVCARAACGGERGRRLISAVRGCVALCLLRSGEHRAALC